MRVRIIVRGDEDASTIIIVLQFAIPADVTYTFESPGLEFENAKTRAETTACPFVR